MILSWFFPWIVIPFSSCKLVFKIVIPSDVVISSHVSFASLSSLSVHASGLFQIMIPSDSSLERGLGGSSLGGLGSSVSSLPYDGVGTSLMAVLTTVLSCLAKHSPASNSSEASLERMSAAGDTMASRSSDIIR